VIAGGTDLLPNMKRRHQTPATLVSLRQIEALKKVTNGSGTTLGAGLTLTKSSPIPRCAKDTQGCGRPRLKSRPFTCATWARSAAICAGHALQLLQNQTYEWRKAIDFCLKKTARSAGCHGEQALRRGSSTDTAPCVISLGASVCLVSTQGERDVALADLYRNTASTT